MVKSLKFVIILLTTILFSGSLCKEEKPSTKEGRGLWVTRWEWAIQSNADLPALQQQRIIEIFDDAKKAKLNFVVFQIRGMAMRFIAPILSPGPTFLLENWEKTRVGIPWHLPWHKLIIGAWNCMPGSTLFPSGEAPNRRRVQLRNTPITHIRNGSSAIAPEKGCR